MSVRRVAQASLLAAAFALVFATHVFTAYRPVRLLIVRSSQSASQDEVRVSVSANFDTASLRVPFAIVWRARNRSGAPATLTFSLDGQRVCDGVVNPGSTRRFDCVVSGHWRTDHQHQISVTGSAVPWSVEYVELATQHGGENGVIVFPSGSTAIERPHLVAIGLVWLAIALTLLVPVPPKRRRVFVVMHRVLSCVFAAAMVLASISTFVTPYAVVFASSVFFKWTAVILVWQIVAVCLWLRGRSADPSALDLRMLRLRPTARALCVAFGVVLIYSALTSTLLGDLYQGNYSGFLHVARQWVDSSPILGKRADIQRTLVVGGGGYDGQFMYIEAFDPFLRLLRNDVHQYRAVVDNPPYRFGRIGFPILIKLVSFDRWQAYPVVMTWSILIALGVGAFILSAIAQRRGARPIWGALILLIPGFWQSVQVALPEPIAAALVLGGVWCVIAGRWPVAGILFGLSALFRETSVVFGLCFAAGMIFSGKPRRALVFGVLVLTPIVAWHLYLGSTLYSDFGMRAYFYGSNDLTVPFTGFIDLWHQVAAGTYQNGNHDLARAATLYPLLLTLGLVLILASAIHRPSPLAIAGTIYGVLAVSLNYRAVWLHVGSGQRATFEFFIAIVLISVACPEAGWLRWVRRAFWTATAAYVFFGAFDASYIRNAILGQFW